MATMIFLVREAKYTERDRTSRTEESGIGERVLYTTISYRPYPPSLIIASWLSN